MRNILSYQPGSKFSGKEINEFCEDQMKNHGSHYKEAKHLYMHYIFKDSRMYELVHIPFRMYEPERVGFLRVT